MTRILITGGAGFVGANLAVALAARHPDWEVVALDNLHRRGSELNLPRLREAGVEFVHGDVREPDDLDRRRRRSTRWSSARPSRRCWPGVDGDTAYLVQTNLIGAYNCLELGPARRRPARLPLDQPRLPGRPRSALACVEDGDALRARRRAAGSRAPRRAGIAEDFPLTGARTLYGATKLAAELLIAEYRPSLRRPGRRSTAAA